MKYVNIVIDNKSDSTDTFYTYGCSDESVKTGSKVYVPFARNNRLREGYVVSVSDEIDDKVKEKLKYVENIDDEVSLTEEMVRTSLWVSKRYLCRYIDAVRCFTPAGSRSKRGSRKDPFQGRTGEPSEVEQLTAQQKAAMDAIEGSLEAGGHDRFLIHGVTGSGKTELYMRTAEAVLKKGKKVIVLVPEISLTTQIIDRFIGKFGYEEIAVLHSRLSPGERYDQWKKIRDGDVNIVIGARSAVFAPMDNIGLIVVDEEHESTYKSDYTPKYDTVEVAIKRLQDEDNQGILLLGSATPSVATYSRGREGIFKILELTERYNNVRLPQVKLVDMREELKAGNKSMISRELYDSMEKCLKEGRQVMLFLNRRGYSTFISCRECGYVAKCPSCGVSLTFHKKSGKAMCHYCGYSRDIMERCPECGSRYIRHFGSGTEKVEETVAEMFPEYTADRVDLDSVGKKGELDRKLRAFKKGDTRILIGTQIIAKGLDFKNVGMVGIVSADVALNIPDFRSPERTFQIITQAAGRAGRGEEVGQVIIQTYSPEHYAVAYAAEQDYKGFYDTEIQLREYMSYPPYGDLFQIVFSSEDKDAAFGGARKWHDALRDMMSADEKDNVFEPQEAYINKIKETYRYSMLIKCPKGKRREYSEKINVMRAEDKKDRKKRYTAVTDINPYSFI